MSELKADPNSPWYPFFKVYEGYYDLLKMIDVPRKVMDYVLDMPDGYYTPQNNNAHPRSLLWKYLYYDGAHPEEQPLPTPTQKMSVLFDPNNPTSPPSDKGYRLIPQVFIKPSQTDAQTRIYIYMGPTQATSDLEVQLSIVFDIWTHYTQQANTKSEAYSRVDAIEKCLIAAFHGIDITGVGSVYFNRAKHSACGSDIMDDGDSNVGRRLVLGIQVSSDTIKSNTPYNNVPSFGKVRLA